MATYPSTLPAPRIDSLTDEPADLLLRTQMDSGVAKVRRKFSYGADMLSFTLRLDETQAATLRTFYDTTLGAGASTFDYTHPRTGAAVTGRFMKPPRLKLVGWKMYDADMEIEIIP